MKRDGIQIFPILSQILGSKIFYCVQIACMQREIVGKIYIYISTILAK